MDAILFFSVVGGCLKFATISKDLLHYYIVFFPKFLWWDENIYLVSWAFISRPASLLASKKILFFMLFMFLPAKLPSST